MAVGTRCGETLHAVEGLAVDPGYARRYGEFQRLTVYGSEVEYAACIGTLRELSGRLGSGSEVDPEI